MDPLRSRFGRFVSVVLTLLGVACGLPKVGEVHAPGSIPSPDQRPTLTVTVRDPSGSPVAGAWVVLAGSGRDRQTEGDGVARLTDLAAGTYHLRARTDDFGVVGPVDVVVGDLDQTLELQLPGWPRARLVGRVSAPDGTRPPLAGATVFLDGLAVATTESDGRFVAEGVAGGGHTLRIEGPVGSWFVPWEVDGLDVAEGAEIVLDVVLPGHGSPSSRTMGGQACVPCHAEIAAEHGGGAHGRAGRDPLDVDNDGPASLVDGFSSGLSVTLADPAGAVVRLGRDGPGQWWAQVEDTFGTNTGPLPVVEVYGAHLGAAAFAVLQDGARAVLPVAFVLPPARLEGIRTPTWDARWTEGWFDAGGALVAPLGPPGPQASWDLSCAGCHSTGARLVEELGRFELRARSPSDVWSRRVDCEACHGPGEDHVAAAWAGQDPARLIFQPGHLPRERQSEPCAGCHGRWEPSAHPFSTTPAYLVQPDGTLPDPADRPGSLGTPSRVVFNAVSSSRLHHDQAGDLGAGPHGGSDGGYVGACGDCHLPHGSSHRASLRRDPADPTLCTSCHASRFALDPTGALHDGHAAFDPGVGSGACGDCHLARVGHRSGADPSSGAGQSRSHTLLAWSPQVVLDEFDVLGADSLDPALLPVTACADCHALVDEANALTGELCPTCPAPIESGLRIDWEAELQAFTNQRGAAQ